MVAINFTMFVDKVAAREKRRTIRKSARCKVGDKIQLYTGMRTKSCRKLVEADAVCTRVAPIKIVSDDFLLCHGYGQTPNAREGLAKLDGFTSYKEMADWFDEKYGLPFEGYLHVWNWPLSQPKETSHE